MVRDVLIDLDDTILDFHAEERVALFRAFDLLGIPQTEEYAALYHEINDAQWRLLEEGKTDRRRVLTERFRLFFEAIGRDGWEAAPPLYEKCLSERHAFIPGAQEMLRALSSRYRLWLCSNGFAHIQSGRIRSAGISPFFRGIFVSETTGADKPSAAYFHAVFSRIPDFDPALAVMVGDSLTSDIQGGVNAGIRTVWFNAKHKENKNALPIDAVYERAADLPDILAKM